MSTVEHFDAVVVGSGFGGSVTAYRLREAGHSVCLLERGKAWAPGQFPRTPREIAVNFWDPSEGLYGFFDVWTFKGIEALVSSCLGGGSIIYANVLLRKDEEWFVKEEGEYWPVTRKDLEPHYDNVEAVIRPQQYPFDVPPYSQTPKTLAMRDAATAVGRGRDWQLPHLAVTFGNPGQVPVPGAPIEDDDNLYGRRRYTCRLCGECDIGCNLGSKNTLDLTYLSRFKKAGGDIRTLAEVRTLEPRQGGGFTIRYRKHHPDRGETREVTLSSDRLILSAGSLGTTYLLLRNRSSFPSISKSLGTHWCGNGDLLGFLVKAGRPLEPAIGPVITSAIRYEGQGGRGYYIEDGGYPNFTSWLIEGTDAPGIALRAANFIYRRVMNWLLKRPVSNISGEFAALLGDTPSARTVPLLGMGRDVPDGRLYLKDGYLESSWTMRTSRAYYDSMKRSMDELAKALDARFRDEPLWYFQRVITVHPVGGCPMGRDATEGVVDSYGQVFGYPGLSIADGSVMPGPVGPNPALTIAAVADRSAEWMLGHWRPTP